MCIRDSRKTNPEAQKLRIVLVTKGVGMERSPHTFAHAALGLPPWARGAAAQQRADGPAAERTRR